MRIVIALGGNALTTAKEKVTFENLHKRIGAAIKNVVKCVNKKNELAIVFGSGPQIGALVIQNEIAKKSVDPMPLSVLDAELQGELGYIIDQSLVNALAKSGVKKPVVSIVTQVLVKKNDSAFQNPSKPIGSFFTKVESQKMVKKGLKMKEESGKGWRRVVPSPKPFRIIEGPTIKKLIKDTIVIAAGGGGIPVIEKNGVYKGIDAVIDKDMASACLANEISAEVLLILTDIESAYLNFGKKDQKKIERIKAAELKKYLNEGHFGSGNMRPKIEACIEFVKNGGKMVVITNPNNLEKALLGKAGTIITR